MATAYALLVGLTRVDRNSRDYSSLADPERRDGIRGSEVDVTNMERMLVNHGGFTIHKLLTEQADRTSILNKIDLAASSLQSGDLFLFYFSGHGDQVADINGDENDNKDEALAAYDLRIVDDELPPRWAKFRSGVRILMISDTCNSGTIFRGLATPRPALALESPLQIKASLIHLGATRDSTDTLGDPRGSAFTSALLKVWNNGAFQGDYHEFFSQVEKIKPGPVLSLAGPNTTMFVSEVPFTV